MINKFFQSWMMIGKINFSLSSIFEVIFIYQKFYWNQFIITPYWYILIERIWRWNICTADMPCNVLFVNVTVKTKYFERGSLVSLEHLLIWPGHSRYRRQIKRLIITRIEITTDKNSSNGPLPNSIINYSRHSYLNWK